MCRYITYCCGYTVRRLPSGCGVHCNSPDILFRFQKYRICWLFRFLGLCKTPLRPWRLPIIVLHSCLMSDTIYFSLHFDDGPVIYSIGTGQFWDPSLPVLPKAKPATICRLLSGGYGGLWTAQNWSFFCAQSAGKVYSFLLYHIYRHLQFRAIKFLHCLYILLLCC